MSACAALVLCACWQLVLTSCRSDASLQRAPIIVDDEDEENVWQPANKGRPLPSSSSGGKEKKKRRAKLESGQLEVHSDLCTLTSAL